jgi:hypothetical protein
MAEIVNLRQARKATARGEAARNAEANRAKFGRGKGERRLAQGVTDRIAQALERAKRESAQDKPD